MDTPSTDITARIAHRLEATIGPRPYAMWFNRSARFAICDPPAGGNGGASTAHGRTLRVDVPNRFVADWIGRNFTRELQTSAEQEVGQPIGVDLHVDPARFQHDPSSSTATPTPTSTPTSSAPAAEGAEASRHGTAHGGTSGTTSGSSYLLANAPMRHRLEDFIVGPSNELAFAAADRLTTDDHPLGPVFLHGPCGMGKTHILQGTCRRAIELDPSARVVYTTGERFTNDFIAAIREGRIEAFRRKLRQIDLLAVDDIHFIADKTKTQLEFLHRFEEIDLSGSRVLLAGDQHPRQIQRFSDALISRCLRGLVVEVKPPDEPTRRRLVDAFAERMGMSLQEEAAATLAASLEGSVRELEGNMTKLHALASLIAGGANGSIQGHRPNGDSIGLTLVRRLLGMTGPKPSTRPLKFPAILGAVCLRLHITPEQALSKSRQGTLVLARSLAVHLTRELTAMSYPEITYAMGRSNHSSAITASQRMQQQLDADREVKVHGGEKMPLRRLRNLIHRDLTGS